mmetsp:Transcript_18620/g.15903  ORF Transcript_18620/g.15903 Transcript_18620/m.15903 type:complete len:130 (-) Transcript_18620:224-613(-)
MRLAAVISWNIPDGEFDGKASNPYIDIKCHFNTAGSKPTVVIEAKCNNSMEWLQTVDPLELKISLTRPQTFVIADRWSADYEEFIDYLNFKCHGQRFKKGDFATYKITSVGNQLKISEEGRWINIIKVH